MSQSTEEYHLAKLTDEDEFWKEDSYIETFNLFFFLMIAQQLSLLHTNTLKSGLRIIWNNWEQWSKID